MDLKSEAFKKQLRPLDDTKNSFALFPYWTTDLKTADTDILQSLAGQRKPADYQSLVYCFPRLKCVHKADNKNTIFHITSPLLALIVPALPLLKCFFLVLRRIPLIPGTGFMSLLLMGGGCSMGLGARVRQTGRPAAHIRMPVMPDACKQHTHTYTHRRVGKAPIVILVFHGRKTSDFDHKRTFIGFLNMV